jgi:peptide/nickel transport system substrate-binding protein
MIPPGYPFASEPLLERYGERDLALAIELLGQAGYTEDNPFVFDLWYPGDYYGASAADVLQLIQAQLEETGRIRVNLHSLDWAEYAAGFLSGESFPAFFLGWFPDYFDPDSWLRPFATCRFSPGNGVNYCNPEMDDLIQAAGAAANPAEREQIYAQIANLYAAEVPTLPLYWEPEFIASRAGIEGIAIGPPFEFDYSLLVFGGEAQPAAGSPDSLIIGTTHEVLSLDPQDAFSAHDWEILKNTGVPLLRYEPGGSRLAPGAAAGLPEASEDGLAYTYILREDLTFADGTPVMAQDYLRAWERLVALDSRVSGLVRPFVERVEAPDERTLVYHLAGPFAFFPALTATSAFIPAHPQVYAGDEAGAFPEKIPGLGPYQMVAHIPGAEMVLEANPNYYGDPPGIPRIVIRYFADPSQLAEALMDGEIDIAWRSLGPAEAARLAEAEGLMVTRLEAPVLRYLVFNHNFPGQR